MKMMLLFFCTLLCCKFAFTQDLSNQNTIDSTRKAAKWKVFKKGKENNYRQWFVVDKKSKTNYIYIKRTKEGTTEYFFLGDQIALIRLSGGIAKNNGGSISYYFFNMKLIAKNEDTLSSNIDELLLQAAAAKEKMKNYIQNK